MGLLADTAEWFKSRRTPIDRWYKDDQGRYAFRVSPNGETLYVSAVTQQHSGGHVSVMQKLIDRASDADADILLRVRDDFLVFDPAAFYARDDEDTIRNDREKRGETWLRVPTEWGVSFEAYMDGHADPSDRTGDLSNYTGTDAEQERKA